MAYRRFLLAALFMALLNLRVVAHGMDVPSMATYSLNWDDMVTPEVHEGVVMEIRSSHMFILNEKQYLILKETEIDGTPASQSSVQLRKGAKVRVTSYRLPNKTNFVADLSIVNDRR